MCIIGTRPEIIKMEPVIRSLRREHGSSRVSLVHSGQHYDVKMSEYFLKELGYPKPDLNLRVGSGSHAEQTARMIVGYEKAICRLKPDIVLAQGDTNTVVAAGLAAIKLKIPFGHVESGLRCFDRSMPEEINRTIADDCAQYCFAPTAISASNLMREGISPKRIFVTGNTIVEACKRNLTIARKHSTILKRLGLEDQRKLILITAHREENTDNPTRLKSIIKSIQNLKDFQIVYPIHPRARKMLRLFSLDNALKRKHILTTEPLGYWDFLRLLEASNVVLTDSGGVQEEALTVGVPCLTLRYVTERPETVRVGANFLVGTEPSIITKQVKRVSQDPELRRKLRSIDNPLGDEMAGERIAKIITNSRNGGVEHARYMRDGAPSFRLLRVLKNRSMKWLERKCPGCHVMVVYDSAGEPVLPDSTLQLKVGWHVQAVGEEFEIQLLANELHSL